MTMPTQSNRFIVTCALAAGLLLSSFNCAAIGDATCSIIDPWNDEIGGMSGQGAGMSGGGSSDGPAPSENPSPCSLVGNPVNLFSGNKIQEEVDYAASTPNALRLLRTYNSYDGIWRHNYSASLVIGPVITTHIQSDGSRNVFLISGMKPLYGARGKLSKAGNLWAYENEGGARQTFDEQGRLVSQRDAMGLVQTLSHAGNTLTIRNQTGQQMVLTEGVLGQPTRAAIGGVQITYAYSTDASRLLSVSRLAGGQTRTRSYHYEVGYANWLLTGITDENGVRFATWRYDDQYRAISSEHAGGAERTTLTYVDPFTTIVTNALGKKTTYRFKEINYSRRITQVVGEPSANCPLTNSSFEYDSKGRLTAHVQKNGTRTLYQYNDRNLLIQRIEAADTPVARQTQTEWHAQFPKPVKITSPTAITTYTYDTQGRPLTTAVSKRS